MAGLSKQRAKSHARSGPESRNEPPATPYSKGYRMPAEWAPHQATWLAWPHERTDWPAKFAPIPSVYADILRHLARAERVGILVQNPRRAPSKSGASSKKPAQI